MALPRENRTAKVIAVEEAIKKMSPQELAELPGLDGEDFKVFGTLIQHFCFIDLNLRRALELFAISKMLPKGAANRYQDLPDSELTKLPDSELTKALIEIVKGMDAKVEDIPTALTCLEGISKARGCRNLVGHFAGKRFPNHDVYNFASKSDQDARKVLGRGLAAHRVYTAVAGRSEFLEMTKSVEQAQLWLAKKIPEWDQRYRD
jgi:hypothetical protein